MIYSSIDANEGANSQPTSSSLAPWESTQPQTSAVVRSNDENHHRHRESNNMFNRSQHMHNNGELPYSAFARQDHIAENNSSGGGNDNESPVVVTSAPWLQPSLWTNDNNDSNHPYSSSTDSARQQQDNTFTLDLLDGPLSSLVSSPKKQDTSSYPPRQRAVS